MVCLQVLNDEVRINFKAIARQIINHLQGMVALEWHVHKNLFEVFMLIVGNGAYVLNKTYGQRCMK